DLTEKMASLKTQLEQATDLKGDYERKYNEATKKMTESKISETDLQKEVSKMRVDLEKLKTDFEAAKKSLELTSAENTKLAEGIKKIELSNRELSKTNSESAIRISELTKYESAYRFADMYLDNIKNEVSRWRPSTDQIN